MDRGSNECAYDKRFEVSKGGKDGGKHKTSNGEGEHDYQGKGEELRVIVNNSVLLFFGGGFYTRKEP